jgi:hypothetical protein
LSRENKLELCRLVSIIFCSLSETKSCRVDMLSKGITELLKPVITNGDETVALFIIKALHNMLKLITHFPSATFAVAVNTTVEAMNRYSGLEIYQYCSDCFQTFTLQDMCRKPRVISKIIVSLPKLLISPDMTTQYFAYNTCGNIFFLELSKDPQESDYLLKKFIESGFFVKDPDAIFGLPVALVKLSQDEGSFENLRRLGLIVKVLDLALHILSKDPQTHVVQLACIISLCRSAAKLTVLDVGRKNAIAAYVIKYAYSDDKHVLLATMQTIRCILDCKICDFEFATSELIQKIIKTLYEV